MNTQNTIISKLFKTVLIAGLTTASAAPALAQDNRIPLNYRNLNVRAMEVRGNQNYAIAGAKVTVEAEKRDRYIRLPLTRTTQSNSGIARMGKIPPSQVVGEYKVTVETKDCGKQTRRFRKNGGSDQSLLFQFDACGKAAENKAEFDRRKQGGYDLIVKLKESRGTRGNGYWVHVIDRKGKLVKKVRTSGTGQAQFRALNPELAPYDIDVYAANKLKAEYDLRKIDKDKLVTIDLDRYADRDDRRGGNDRNDRDDRDRDGGYYDLTVKIDADMYVNLVNGKGRTVAKKEYDGRGVKFDDVNPKHGPYSIDIYLGGKKIASYDYKMPERHASVSYSLR